MSDFDDVKIYSGTPEDSTAISVAAPSALVTVDQSRAIAEVQAAMVVARMNPRDETRAYQRILTACKRRTLAEQASYAYKRGGQIVTGPSIRLAEVLARSWGNITYGLREISRESGRSEIEAFCWDLETNTRVTRQFSIRHIRDKKTGNENVTAERDIYELVASMGQRRVRACILEVIPGDIVEAAEEECKKTLASSDGKPMADRIRDMVVAFGDFGVTSEMIAEYLGHKVEAIVPAELVRLKQIYRSLRDGLTERDHFFRLADEPKAEKKRKPAASIEAQSQWSNGERITCPEGTRNAGDQMDPAHCSECQDWLSCSAIAVWNEAHKE